MLSNKKARKTEPMHDDISRTNASNDESSKMTLDKSILMASRSSVRNPRVSFTDDELVVSITLGDDEQPWHLLCIALWLFH